MTYKYIFNYIEIHTIANGVRIKISYAGLSNIYLAIPYIFNNTICIYRSTYCKDLSKTPISSSTA